MRARPAAPTLAGGLATLAGGFATLAVLAGPACPVAAASTSGPSAPVSGASRAPTGPPLVSSAGEGEQEEGAAGGTQVDPLVANGLGSPSCGSAIAAELDPASRRDCETSGFVASAAPTQDYGLDVHIDTGLLGLGSGELLSIVQDLFVAPVWMALVWAAHALLVMLEWAFSLDLLRGGSATGLQPALAGALASFTGPWLTLALSVAAMATAYNGLVRRRVAQTLGEALLTGMMMAGGIWLILDPLGTVGTLSGWSSQASLGTLAAAAHGTPASPGRALGESFGAVFAATIEAPWCYLEFGDVAWCRQPARLDSALRAAGLRIAARESTEGECVSGCAAGASARALTVSARLLREAHTNGALFLALPPNGPDRNSINDSGSLLRTLCASSEATDCQGPLAAEAEFRTGGGTWSRVGGLLLICAGLSGMMLLLGHIALRLLLAAMLSVFYLLLAPALVIAPALGEPGRALFRAWAGRLLAAVFSKLIFAFLLGVVLTLMAMVEGLGGLGWWTQWLLLSALWWGLFLKRRTLLAAVAPAGRASAPKQLRPRIAGRVSAAMLATDAYRARRARRDTAATSRVGAPGPGIGRGGEPDRTAPGTPDRLAEMCLRHEEQPGHGARRALARQAIRRAEPQLARIERAREAAAGSGDRRRAARLQAREARVRAELEEHRATLLRLGADGSGRGRRGTRETRLRAWSQYLDEQAARPRGLRPGGPDYPELSGLAGMSRGQYERLGSGRQRAARHEIDRALAARRAGSETPNGPRPDAGGPPAGADEPLAPPRRGRPPRAPGAAPGTRPAWEESEVINDIREVAAGRKRQLGIGRP